MNKLFRAFICWLLIATQAFAGITYSGTTGQTLYARVQTGASTFVACALTEGSSGGLGIYSVTDAALVTAGLNTASAGNGFEYTIRSGTASTTANDTIKGYGTIPWSGAIELARPASNPFASGKTLYFALSGTSSGPGTKTAPYDTYEHAEAAANYGDTIWLIGVYTSPITVDKSVWLRGDNGSKSLISTSGTNDIGIFITDAAETKDLKISNIGMALSGTNSVAIAGDDIQDLEITAVRVLTAATGFDIGGDARNVVLRRNYVGATVKAVHATNCHGMVIDGGTYEVDCATDVDCAAFSLDGCLVTYEHSPKARVVRTVASAKITAGLATCRQVGTVGNEAADVSGTADLSSLDVSARATSASNTGPVYGVTYSLSGSSSALPFNCKGSGFACATSNAGSGGAVDIHTNAGSIFSGTGLKYSTSSGAGLVYPNDVTIAAINTLTTDVTNGLAAIKTTASSAASSAATAATEATTAATATSAIKPKTDQLTFTTPNVVDASGGGGGGGTASQVNNNEPIPAFTAKLGSRADGITKAFPVIHIRPGEKFQVWIDCSKLTSINLGNVANGVSSNNAKVTITSVGMYGKFASIVGDATAASDGDTTTITCDVTPVGSLLVKASLDIVVDAN